MHPRVATETLLDLYKEHRTLDAVAAIVGIDRTTIHKRLKSAGYTPATKSFTDAEREAVRQYYSETLPGRFSLSEIAALVGHTRTSVSRVARELGLTNCRRPASEIGRWNIKQSSQGRWSRNPHPRGMTGKPQSEKCRVAVGAATKLKWATDKAFGIGFMSEQERQRRSDNALRLANERPASDNYSRCKHGRRADLGDIFFRSSWEANYARYLNLLMKMKVVEWWDFEQETFWFEAIKRGVRSYKPDFRVKYRSDDKIVRVEVKGWMDDKSKTKLKRMRIYHPDIKIEVVGKKEYLSIKRKWGSAIPMWEG